jgi:excisionase family DNA binding protein
MSANQLAVIESQYVTIKEAQVLIRASRSTIYNLLADQRIHAVKRGHRTLVELRSLREYLASLPKAEIGPQSNRALR